MNNYSYIIFNDINIIAKNYIRPNVLSNNTLFCEITNFRKSVIL